MRIHVGEDSLGHLEKEMNRVGVRRAAIVCGSTMAKSASTLRLVIDGLGEKYAGVFGGVRAHSPTDSVLEAVRSLRQLRADAVVAVGGGSAIVTARAAGIVLAEGEDFHRLCTQRSADGKFTSPKLAASKLPQFVVPTTPTTAIVKAGSAVFDLPTQQRLALFDPKTRAQAVFVHPVLAATAPHDLALSASLNGLVMACEGLESTAAQPLSDALLMHALRLYRDKLPSFRSAPSSSEAWSQLILASVLAGKGTDHASGGMASVLGHAIGIRCQIENGIANAIVLPHTIRFNENHSRGGAASIGEVFAGRANCSASEVTPYLSQFLRTLGVPLRLRDMGVSEADLEVIAAAAMDDWFLSKNSRPIQSCDEIRGVLRAAW
jgi:alcohol dehydrogenase class IV